MRSPGARAFLIGMALVSLFGIGCGQKKSGEAGSADAVDVAAQMKGRVISKAELEETLRSIPPDVRRLRFGGARGRMRFLDLMIDRELMVRAAEELGLDQETEISKQLSDYRTNLLVQAYERHMTESLPQPTEDEIRRYYEENRSEFVVPARVNASWIQCATKNDCEKARRRIVDGGEEFARVALQVSTHAETAKDGGLLGYFNPTGYVHGIGHRPDFSKHAFELDRDEVGPVFEFDGAWGFIRVREKTIERDLPFEQAHRRIVARLRPTPTDSLRNAALAQLRRDHDVQSFLDLASELEDKSAAELMRMATESVDVNDKIDYYQALLQKYPHFVRADEAQFMIGFLYSESLNNPNQAILEFKKVLEGYPESELCESAAYMVQNLRDAPKLQVEAPPEALKDGPDPVPGPDTR